MNMALVRMSASQSRAARRMSSASSTEKPCLGFRAGVWMARSIGGGGVSEMLSRVLTTTGGIPSAASSSASTRART